MVLAPGESKTVTFSLENRSFAVWADGWKIPAGTYGVLVGAAADDIRLQGSLEVDGENVLAPVWQAGSWYETLKGLPADAEFEALYGSALQTDPPIEKDKFTISTKSNLKTGWRNRRFSTPQQRKKTVTTFSSQSYV